MNKAKKIAKVVFKDDIWRGMLANLVKFLNAKQVIEFGADEGLSTQAIADVLPKKGKVYSVDIRDCWERLGNSDKVVKIIGDDLNKELFKGINLKKTDIWEFDSDHSTEHLTKLWQTYKRYFKDGAVIAVDDLHFPEVKIWWDTITEDKWDNERTGIIVI